MTTPGDDDFGLVGLALRTHRDLCKEQLRFLRARAGRRQHRLEVLDQLRAVRRDLTALESGDHEVAERIIGGWLRPPELPESALVLNDTGVRRGADELRAMFKGLCSEHDRWLSSYAARHANRWRSQLASDPSVEGAIWEALCRRWLTYFVDTIEPAEDGAGAGPDFRCVTNGTLFYVEATCVRIEATTRRTTLSDVTSTGGSYAMATPSVWQAIEREQRQCEARQDGPTILFVGTLHQLAAWIAMGERVATEFLTGSDVIAWQIHVKDNVQVGSSGPFSRTYLHGAAFVAADGPPGQPLGTRNRHAAAVLVGTSGMFYPNRIVNPAPFVGAVHPEPAIPFDPPSALPGVRFLRLSENWRRGILSVDEVVRPRS